MTSQNQIQSYVLTVAKYDSNIYAKRILNYIVKASQDYLEGQKLNDIIKIDQDLFKNRIYTIDLKDVLMGDKDTHYSRIKDAFNVLQDKFLIYDDDDNYVRVPFITALHIQKSKGFATFSMAEPIYKAFTDYTRGYRKYQLSVSLSLTSVYSIRFYELISGQENPITYTIDKLKEMFEITDRYNEVKDLIRRVIEPAKKELTEKAPYTFDYTLNTDKEHVGPGRKPYKSITIRPIYQPDKENGETEAAEIAKRVNLSAYLAKGDIDYILDNFGFTKKGIRSNHELFIRVKKKKGVEFINWLATIKEKALKKRGELFRSGQDVSNFNMAGWLINSLRLEARVVTENQSDKAQQASESSPSNTEVVEQKRDMQETMESLAKQFAAFKKD